MIILIGGEKGGTGKTTIAVNLAVFAAQNGNNVIIIDTDKQQSAAGWCTIRKEMMGSTSKIPKIEVASSYGYVQKDIKAAAKEYSHVIVDAGGRDSVELRAAMTVADKFYTPIRASQFDLVTLSRLHKIILQARELNTNLLSKVMVNCASTHPKVNDTREAVEYIALFHAFTVSAVIKERVAFRKTGYTGLGVTELPGRDYDKNAVNELTKLAKEIYHE